MSDPSLDLLEIRATEFAALGDVAYLDVAGLGPMPQRTRQAIAAFNELRSRPHEMGMEAFLAPVEQVRQRAARLIGAAPEEIALGQNTSFGINLAALALPVPRGSTVLVSDREFPTNVYPWMQREHLRLEIVAADADGLPDEDRLRDRLADGDVSVLAVSSVQFASGFHADLGVLGDACREAGAFFVVDAIQSLGHLPIDVRRAGIHILATGGYKWLCGPFGAGFAYIERDLQDRMTPPAVGAGSMAASQDLRSLLGYEWSPLPDARRYEVGTPPFQDYAGLAASLDLLLAVDVPRIAEHVDSILLPLRDWLRERPEVRDLTDHSPRRRSGIISFRPPGLEATHEALRAAGVHCAIREGALRVAAHFYNTTDDVARLLEVLEARATRGWR